MALAVRDAAREDLAAIVAIYNDVLRTSTAVFSEEEQTLAERAAWWAAQRAAGRPALVAVAGDEVVGFAAYAPFRPWPGYRLTVEHSVHVRADRRRGGVGGTLLAALLDRARDAGVHAVIAAVDATNTASIALHERFGFVEVGRLPEVAIKHGRWLDLVLLELLLAG